VESRREDGSSLSWFFLFTQRDSLIGVPINGEKCENTKREDYLKRLLPVLKV
jgi:hypothetical protein